MLRPYLWATAIEGTQYAVDIPLNVDVSFSDIWENLEYAALGEVELRKGRFCIISDTVLTKVGVSASAEKTKLGNLGLTRIQGEATVDLDSFAYIQSVLVGYRLWESAACHPCSPCSPQRFSVDALFGVRGWILKTDVDIRARVNVDAPGGQDPTTEKSAKLSQKMDWLDPVVGARLNFDLTERLSGRVQGDVGGFGAGSDFSWQASAILDFKLCDHWSLFGGYRVLDVDYRDGPAGWDSQYFGPIAGAEYRISF